MDDGKRKKLENAGWTVGDTEQFLEAREKRDEIVASLCNHLDRKQYQSDMILRRANMILDNDFGALVEDGPTDGTTGRPVPNELLVHLWVEKHGGKQGWDAFCSRTVKRWVKFIKKTNFSESDKYFLGGILFKALDHYPS